MSSTTVLAPIAKALMVAAQFLNTDPAGYRPATQQQEQFLQAQYTQQARTELGKFTAQELKTKASTSATEINQFLKEHGFTIELQPFGPQGFGVAAILDVELAWKFPGTATTVMHNNVEHDAVTMRKGFTVFTTDQHPEPVARINTQSADTVYITKAHKQPLTGDALLAHIKLAHIKTVQGAQQAHDRSYSNIVFPMVDLDQQEDISWLKGMTLKNYFITQALQQTKFKMNEVGARVKSAAALALDGAMQTTEEKNLVIDEPFYIWIERDGVTAPVFAAYVTPENWKNPQNLEL
jgi:hypothetical protein